MSCIEPIVFVVIVIGLRLVAEVILFNIVILRLGQLHSAHTGYKEYLINSVVVTDNLYVGQTLLHSYCVFRRRC